MYFTIEIVDQDSYEEWVEETAEDNPAPEDDDDDDDSEWEDAIDE